MPTAFTAAVNNFFVGKHRTKRGTPIDRLHTEICQAMRIQMRLPLKWRARRPLFLALIRPQSSVIATIAHHRNDAIFFFKLRFQFCNWSSLCAGSIVIRAICPQPNRLRPPIIIRIDRAEFARPVISKSQPLKLSPKIIDCCTRCDRWMHSSLNCILFRRQTKRIPSHWMQHIKPTHQFVSRQNVRCGVSLRMSDMQTRP